MMTQGLALHLGCGRRHIPGFVHVDRADFAHIDHHRDVRDLSAFDDGSARLIYACHVFEYFDRLEAAEVLREWRRVLASGGVLRVAVPDFEALVEVYRKTNDLGRVLGPLYGRMVVGDGLIYHKTVYDFHSLGDMLGAGGFVNIRRWDWRATSHADVDDFSQAYFPHMDKANGLLISLNVEATKP